MGGGAARLGGLRARGFRNEYDQTTWAARSWRSFAVQKLSVAAHFTVALEISTALGLSTATEC